MKAKLIITALFMLIPLTPASANDAWIKVDANGNAIGGAVVCSQDVCGDSNSVYSKLTLQPGERYVLQFKGNPVTGNVAGIPATQPDVKLQVNLETNQWTKTTRQELAEPTPVVVNNQLTVVTGVERKETWNPTVVGKETPTPVVNENPEFTLDDYWFTDWFFWDWSDLDAWLQWFWIWLQEQGLGDSLS